MSNIHPSSIVESGATLGENVTIEPFAVVKSGVTLGSNVVLKSHVYIDGNTTIGDGTVIYPGASIGTKTQDRKFQGETTYVHIGKNCEIREYVTINSSSEEGSVVRVGDNCLIMAYCHIAHHCTIGNDVIMANCAMLAGHVEIEDHARIGGMTPIHQWVRIGKHAMVGGLSRVTNDIPPYTIGAGIPYKMGGLNLIGLKRHDYSLDVRKDLSKAFKLIYRSNLPFHDALARIEDELSERVEVQHWIDFCKRSKRGLIGLQEAAAEVGIPSGGDYLEE